MTGTCRACWREFPLTRRGYIPRHDTVGRCRGSGAGPIRDPKALAEGVHRFEDPIVKILARIEIVDECWVFQGSLDKLGYGEIIVAGRHTRTHRVLYEHLEGPVADGLELDHVCRNRSCCNPAHLDPVTHSENMLRAAPFRDYRARWGVTAERCRNGHLRSQYETTNDRGRVRCRACGAAESRRARARKSLQSAA